MIRTNELATLLESLDPVAYASLEGAIPSDARAWALKNVLGKQDGPVNQAFWCAKTAEAALNAATSTLGPKKDTMKNRIRRLDAVTLCGQILSLLGGSAGLATLGSGDKTLALISASLALLGGLAGVVSKFLSSPPGRKSLTENYLQIVEDESEIPPLLQKVQLLLMSDPIDLQQAEKVLDLANKLAGSLNKALAFG